MKTWFLISIFSLTATLAADWNMFGFEDARKKWGGQAESKVIQAAEAGDPSARYYLGRIHQDGGDFAVALHWYSMAKAKHFANAQNNMANIYLTGGHGVEKDAAHAIQLLQELQDTGDWFYIDNLAAAYFQAGRLDDQVDVYVKASAAGHLQAFSSLASIFQSKGPFQDDAKAMEWAQRGADIGDPGSMVLLAEILMFRDSEKSFRLLKSAEGIAKGDVLTLVYSKLGWAHFCGKDWDSSIEAYEKAAARGDTDAMVKIGKIYSFTNGKNEPQKGFEWFRRAAEAGDKDGMQEWGRHLTLTSSTMAEGKRWLRKAVDAGSLDAVAALERIAEGGTGSGKPPGLEAEEKAKTDPGHC